ncbi:hypothetical protein JK358_06090 [Nocardia sp. 2]|uniref:Cyclodipeptide synthase n=1 Tax=Nocardia acididurans TaxID=2802282 RepID=A0ABS1M2B5_9NOCA|nr:tRNA-dependent cyclodipeptide synthase [Nocardia acididurans]MBL1073959.1 hypothetical protein [Nocardia acididurans]
MSRCRQHPGWSSSPSPRTAPAIAGSTTSRYAYHRRIPFVDALFHHELPIHPRNTQGYLILTTR